MFLNVWDVQLEISVVSAHVNLNGPMVHVKSSKMKNQSAHWLGLTDINNTMGKMCGRKNSKRYIADEILLLSLNLQYFQLLLAAFLLWPSILASWTSWPCNLNNW